MARTKECTVAKFGLSPGIEMNETVVALRQIKPGQAVIYYTGSLAHDRAENHDVGFIGGEAYSLYEAGRVELTQRSLPSGAFEYIATGKAPK